VKQLKAYANKQFKSLAEDLESYRHLQDPEVLHKIRVEIKKIKVVLNLINYALKKFKGHQHFIPFRAIFRKAGAIRQPEVLYKLLLLYQVSGIMDRQIPRSAKLDKLSKAFQKEVPLSIEAVKTQKKKIKKYFNQVLKDDARKYVKKKRRELERLLFPTFNKAGLHKARKICKEVVYLHWVDNLPKPDPFFNEVENMIGQWHDKQVLLPIVKKNKAIDEVNKLSTACQEDLINLKKLVSHYYDKP
jgi:CHAD domain-containing protein